MPGPAAQEGSLFQGIQFPAQGCATHDVPQIKCPVLKAWLWYHGTEVVGRASIFHSLKIRENSSLEGCMAME